MSSRRPCRTLALGFLFFVGCSLVGGNATQARQTEATVYRTQLEDLHRQYAALLKRIGTSEIENEAQSIPLRRELLALTTLVHRLGESAEESHFQAVRNGRRSTVTLLLVSQTCEGMSFVLGSANHYVSTRDRVFLSLARQGDDVVTAALKAL